MSVLAAPALTDVTAPSAHQMFSFWSLFAQADWMIRGVIVSLCVASVVSWAVLFAKIMELRQLEQSAQRIMAAQAEGMLEGADGRFLGQCPFAKMALLASREGRVLATRSEAGRSLGLERLEALLGALMDEQRMNLGRWMTVLESIGSMAPFVGLLGTVWGVMNSFQGIAASQNPGIAAVAPGLAEALLTTAIGIGVAIPAVVSGMRLRARIEAYCTRMDIFASHLVAGQLGR